MAGKKKKEKKNLEMNRESLSAVDQTFFEVTINDLNAKLAHLRAHNAKLELRNEELEAEMAQLNDDRADVTGFLNQSLHEQASVIKDLEEKLSELSKVRLEETGNFQSIIKGWEQKFKAMNDQLSSEIKLLNGKLNSLEEFRIQKDELMVKFDQQESDARELQYRHKTILYEMERKQIMDKDRLKKDVEGKLIQLSNEFRKSNEIRIATHVQRMVRENIQLNNELNRILATHRQMDKNMQAMLKRQSENRRMSRTILAENSELARVCDKLKRTVHELSDECRVFRAQRQTIEETKEIQQLTESRETGLRDNLHQFQMRIEAMEQDLDKQQINSQIESARAVKYGHTINQLLDVLKQVERAIIAATQINTAATQGVEINEGADNDTTTTIITSSAVQRKYLTEELERILVRVNDFSRTIDDTISAERTSPSRSIYSEGAVGIMPRSSTITMVTNHRRQSHHRDPTVPRNNTVPLTAKTTHVQLDVCELIDVTNISDTRMSVAESAGSTELLDD